MYSSAYMLIRFICSFSTIQFAVSNATNYLLRVLDKPKYKGTGIFFRFQGHIVMMSRICHWVDTHRHTHVKCSQNLTRIGGVVTVRYSRMWTPSHCYCGAERGLIKIVLASKHPCICVFSITIMCIKLFVVVTDILYHGTKIDRRSYTPHGHVAVRVILRERNLPMQWSAEIQTTIGCRANTVVSGVIIIGSNCQRVDIRAIFDGPFWGHG